MIFTHTTPTDAYRGAGRPEATYAIERTMDQLARELDIDPAELRRKNYIPHGQVPQLHDRGRPHGQLGRLPAAPTTR